MKRPQYPLSSAAVVISSHLFLCVSICVRLGLFKCIDVWRGEESGGCVWWCGEGVAVGGLGMWEVWRGLECRWMRVWRGGAVAVVGGGGRWEGGGMVVADGERRVGKAEE